MTQHSAGHRERLWTPWRMRYIGGDAREDGCIFCNRLSSDDDVSSLILHRSDHAFIIMNLFPYNTGHVMIVPNTHASDLESLDDTTIVDMARLLPRTTTALRRTLNCDGFNIGLNLGADAGAGVAEHLHQHVVPRWQGDANFMPIIAGTMVIPEVIPATYAKLRAELEREVFGTTTFSVLVVSDTEEPAAWLHEGSPLTVTPEPPESVARAALRAVGSSGAEIVGWAGTSSTVTNRTESGLVVRVDTPPDDPDWEAQPFTSDIARIDSNYANFISRARINAAPWIDSLKGQR